MDNFIKVNKEILKTKDSKIITSYILLNQYIDRNGRCKFNLEELIEDCGLKPNRGKGRSIEKFKLILQYMCDNKIISSIENIKNLNSNSYIKCVYNPTFNKNNDGLDCDFIKFNVEYLNKIMQISDKNRCDLIFLLLYLLSYMNDKKKYCYPTIDKIKDDTGFSKNYIIKLTETLIQINILFVDNIGLCSRNGQINTFSNVYALDNFYLNEGLLSSRAYAKAHGYKILNKYQRKIIQQINGLKGSIKRDKNKGLDVSKQEEKLKELKNKLNDKCKCSIDELNKKIDKLNIKCDELGIDGIEYNGEFDENELLEIVEYLENKINKYIDTAVNI